MMIGGITLGIWATICALSSAVISLIIDEGRNPIYNLACMFFGGLSGWIAGSIFAIPTDGLVWDLWSILIPAFLGGIITILVTIYLKDKIPYPSKTIKPLVSLIAFIIIVLLCAYSVIPEKMTFTPVGEERLAVYSIENYETELDEYEIEGIDVIPTNIQAYSINTAYPLLLNCNIYKTASRYPFYLNDNPTEGQYLKVSIKFSVSSSSPVNWTRPVWTILVWADKNNDNQFNSGDLILTDLNYKLPAEAGTIYSSAVCVYNESTGQPINAMYYTISGGNIVLLPIYGAIFSTTYKDDSLYTFANTPEGFKPPYDQWSWAYNPSNGTVYPKENTISGWATIPKGSTSNTVLKIFCPVGMANASTTWKITVTCYDFEYSQSESIATFTGTFNVNPYTPQKPIVTVSFEYFVIAGILGVLGLACVSVIRAGKKFI